MLKAKEKLKSRAGVTIVFALIAFIVATLVSVTLVSVALNNVMRVKGQQETQSEMLSASSAAALLREKLAGEGVKIKQEYLADGTTPDPDKDAETTNIKDKGEEGVPKMDVDKLVEVLAVEMMKGAFTKRMTLSVSGGSEETQRDMAINVKYTGSQLEMTFTPQDALGVAGDETKLCLVFAGVKPEEISKIPIYEEEPIGKDKYGNPIMVPVLKRWIKTTQVEFKADSIYAQAEKVPET